MNKQLKITIFTAVLAVSAITLLHSCSRNNNQNQNQVPNKPVNVTMNLDLPSYIILKSQGTWVYLPDGVRGIIVYHGYDDNFYAYERNCTFNSFDSCATVSVLKDNVYMQCGHYRNDTSSTFISCCGSRFFLEGGGTVAQGPSVHPLKQYLVTRNGSFLQVTN